MGYVQSSGAAAGLWDIAIPTRADRLAGIEMAGFRGRTADLVDIRVIPHPALTMFIDFGDGRLVDDTNDRQLRGGIFAGFLPGSVRGVGTEIDCLQIRLSPAVAYRVLGTCAELGAAMVPLEELWGSDAERVRRRLQSARAWDERFTIAKAALVRRYETGRAVDPEVGFAWARMVHSRGQVRVERLAAETGWSRKRLWSRFGSQIGLTPKRAAQLVRFDHAAHRLAAGHSAALVAADSGYADQSHLNRDMVAFAGITPRAMAAAPWLAVDEMAWAGQAYVPVH
ncbi:AraC family transcriptional regulator [Nocardia sp. NBC_01329]|uniref:AraC family transcriptional regulator n=1 Tax=Nocardia sp. NBC_01329 TaxID=2903594 RepID=UPI002E0ED26B|nr:helix-turn-helix domain-containing protein [Nocardia sp. NBC_01329]